MAFTEKSASGAFNNTTPVTLIDAPGSGQRRVIRTINLYNGDSAAVTVTLQHSGPSDRTICRVQLAAGETLALDRVLVLEASERLTGVLAGAVSAHQPEFVCAYAHVS
jgi:hypothetical protein